MYAAVCCALSATCRLLSTELISAVLPTVTELLKHPKELVRKKAVMAIHRFEQLDPDHDGPLHNVDTYALIRDALRDKVSSSAANSVAINGRKCCTVSRCNLLAPTQSCWCLVLMQPSVSFFNSGSAMRRTCL